MWSIDPKVQVQDEIKICDNGCMKRKVWGPKFQENVIIGQKMFKEPKINFPMQIEFWMKYFATFIKEYLKLPQYITFLYEILLNKYEITKVCKFLANSVF